MSIMQIYQSVKLSREEEEEEDALFNATGLSDPGHCKDTETEVPAMASSNVPSLLSMEVKPNMTAIDDEDESSEFYVRVRGLPFSATIDDILEFFRGVSVIGQDTGVTFTYTRDGRPSGEAYVCVASADDQAEALTRNKNHIGSRYIEVFEAKRNEMEYVVRKSGPAPDPSSVLRMRGLPFGCSKEEIVQFFGGYEIVPNGITMTTDAHGRTAGDAYVQFSTQNVAERAINDKHMKSIGHRYIELFRSTLQEARDAGMSGGGGGGRRPGRPAPYERPERYGGPRGGMNYSSDDFPYSSSRDRYSGPAPGRFKEFGRSAPGGYGGGGGGGSDRFRNGGSRGGRGGGIGSSGARGGLSKVGGMSTTNHRSSTGHSVHMRGLPFSAAEKDIAIFFSPLMPVDIVLGMNHDGRKSGEADVDFETHDEACEAMKKDKSHMEHRYIELFLNSSSSGMGGGGGGGGGGGSRMPRSRHDFGGPPSLTESRFNSSVDRNYSNNGDLYRPTPSNYGFNSSQIPPSETGGYY